MCTVSVIFMLAPQSPPATGEQRMILCASHSCTKEGCLQPEVDTISHRHWTHSAFSESLLPTAHTPPMPLPTLNLLYSHPPSSLLPIPCTCPFSFPPCGHLKCLCWAFGSISIFTPSPPCFHPGSQCYASFILGAEWPIFSVWPRAAIVHHRSTLSCCSRTGPEQQLWVWQPGSIGMGSASTDSHSEQSILAVLDTLNFKSKMTKLNHTALRTRQRWRNRPIPVA